MTRPPTSAGQRGRRASAPIWLILIILLCLALKVRQNDRPFFTGADGGLYTDIAEHVRDGDGLVTDLSLYHHGYEGFPHPTAIYPLWPLVYGCLSRLAPMHVIGVWVPTLGYLLALVFAYLWAGGFTAPDRRAGPAVGSTEAQRPGLTAWAGQAAGSLVRTAAAGLNPGHVLVLFLGLNGRFFTYTSLPYTEGLGYALFFACLWRLHKIGSAASPAHAAEMGGWLAVLMLVRSQFLVAALAAFLALAWVAVRARRKKAWPRLALTAAVFVAFLIPWFIHISGFISDGRMQAMFRYDQARANDLLSPYRMMATPGGIEGGWKDLLTGLNVAFDPSNDAGYFWNFHGLMFVLPLFALLLIARAPKSRRSGVRPAPTGGEDPGFHRAFLVLLSAGAFASLQLMHVDLALPWLFNQRHATILIVPLFLMWLAVARSRWRIMTIAAGFVAAFAVIPCFIDCWNAGAEVDMAAERLSPASRWLAERARGDHDLVVAATGALPQLLAPGAPGVGFHGVYKGTTEWDLHVLFERLGVRWLIMEDHDVRGRLVFESVDPGWFSGYFVEKARLPGYAIYEKKCPFLPEGTCWDVR